MIDLVPLRPQPQAWLWHSVLAYFAEDYCKYLVDTGAKVESGVRGR